VTGSPLRASVNCGIGSGDAAEGAPCAHRGNPPTAKPAAAEPDNMRAWRRVSDVLIDM
jgi:hypothetical protein